MSLDVRDIPVTTVAGIGSMNRLGEFSLTDLAMATEAFGVVDALEAVFPSPDDKLLSLLGGVRWFG